MAQVLNPEAEQRRRRYLGLMGLEAYYARKVLAHAGPSPVFPQVDEEQALAASGNQGHIAAAPGQNSAARPAPESAAATRAGPTRQPTAVTGRKPVAVPEQQPTAVSTQQPAAIPLHQPDAVPARQPIAVPPQQPTVAPTRQLFYFRVDSSLAVLTQDRWQGEEGAACLDLLRNILRALGLGIDGAGVAIPILHGQAADSTAQKGDSLDALCRHDGCANLLIFAHNGAELFPEVAPSTTDFRRRIGGVSLRVTVTRGLREMLAFPDLKKHCWKDLQPLRGRLRRISEKPPEQAPQGGE